MPKRRSKKPEAPGPSVEVHGDPARYKRRDFACEVCGHPIAYYGPGYGPTRCDEHVLPRHRKQRLEGARARGDTERAKRLAQAHGEAAPTAGVTVIQAARLAGALAVVSEPREAAQLAGLDPDAPDFRRLLDAARGEWATLVEGAQVGVLRVYHYGLLAIGCDLAEARTAADRQRLTAAARALTDAIEKMTSGSAKPVYGHVRFVIEEVD